jgi:hypothetical protein
MFMRPTPELEVDRAREMARDEENAAREYDCIPGVRGGSRLFDVDSIRAAIVEGRPLAVRARPGSFIGAGGDVAFERDSSAIAVVARGPDQVVELLEYDEIVPSRGAPLSPGYVITQRFAPLMKSHRVHTLWADAFYRQSVVEHLVASGLSMEDAPAGAQGKYDVYMHTRGLLRSGQLRISSAPKLVAQLRAVTSTPLPGGRGSRITSPRRAGSGHGDIVSALVLANWAVRVDAEAAAAYARERAADPRYRLIGAYLGGNPVATGEEIYAEQRSRQIDQFAEEPDRQERYRERVRAARKKGTEAHEAMLKNGFPEAHLSNVPPELRRR